MQPFRYHIFICNQCKAEGLPSCSARGSEKVIEAMRKELGAQGLLDEVQLTTCGSIGLCESGPNMIVYPEGTWYSGIQPEDVPELVRSHFKQGKIVERLARKDQAAVLEEIRTNRKKAQAARKAPNAFGNLPDDLLQTMRGFMESRAMLTGIELNIFAALGDGATASQVAAKIGTNARATEMLLNALTSLGMLTKTDGLFYPAPITARYFGAGSPDNARDAMMHLVQLWLTWSNLTDCVRAGTSVSREKVIPRGEWTEPFIALMHRNARGCAPLVIDAVGIQGTRSMLDIGGGSGAYSIAFAQANDALQVEILDLPDVLPIAQRHIDEAGLSARVKTRPSDLLSTPFGQGFDLILVSAICHSFGVEENRELVKRCYAALAPKGRLIISDFILKADKAAPQQAALFALNMLVGTRNGNCYNESEYSEWLRDAGFQAINRMPLPGPADLIVGTR